jgi:hypothetical protein
MKYEENRWVAILEKPISGDELIALKVTAEEAIGETLKTDYFLENGHPTYYTGNVRIKRPAEGRQGKVAAIVADGAYFGQRKIMRIWTDGGVNYVTGDSEASGRNRYVWNRVRAKLVEWGKILPDDIPPMGLETL